MTQFTFVELAELTDVVFECPECRNEITYRLSTPGELGAPHHCPVCRTDNPALGRAIHGYARWHETAAALKGKLRFRLAGGETK